MLQGNLLGITWIRLAIAFQTGLIAGAINFLISLKIKTKNHLPISILLGITTMIAYYFVHAGSAESFAAGLIESGLTGLIAGLLSYVIGFIILSLRKPQRHIE